MLNLTIFVFYVANEDFNESLLCGLDLLDLMLFAFFMATNISR